MLRPELFQETIKAAEGFAEEAREMMSDLNFRDAFKIIQQIVYLGNYELNNHEFWKLSKSDDPEQLKVLESLLYFVFEISRISSYLLKPYCPELSTKILN